MNIFKDLNHLRTLLFYRLPYTLNWDSTFQARFGSNSALRARAVMAHTQGAFRWATLQTRINLVLRGGGLRSQLNIAPSAADL